MNVPSGNVIPLVVVAELVILMLPQISIGYCGVLVPIPTAVNVPCPAAILALLPLGNKKLMVPSALVIRGPCLPRLRSPDAPLSLKSNVGLFGSDIWSPAEY